MLITAKHIGDQIEFTGLSTSLGYKKAMENMIEAINPLAPQSEEVALTTKVLQGQIQNKTGSSCGAYIFELASRIIRNGGNEISAFNELTNEVSTLSHTARRDYEVEEARTRLLFAYEQRQVEDLIELPKSRLEYKQKDLASLTQNANLAENRASEAFKEWTNTKRTYQRIEQEHKLASAKNGNSLVLDQKALAAREARDAAELKFDNLNKQATEAKEKIKPILDEITHWKKELNIAQQNSEIAKAKSQTKSLINLH